MMLENFTPMPLSLDPGEQFERFERIDRMSIAPVTKAFLKKLTREELQRQSRQIYTLLLEADALDFPNSPQFQTLKAEIARIRHKKEADEHRLQLQLARFKAQMDRFRLEIMLHESGDTSAES